MLDRYELIDACTKYMRHQHTVLWGQFFDIHEHHGREAAIQWLAGVIEDVLGEQIMKEYNVGSD